MIQEKHIKPIPKYIQALIKKRDIKDFPNPIGNTRYYAYLAKYGDELVKVTVAVRNKYKKWYCKQVAVHGVHSDKCRVKDMEFFMLGGYVTGWYEQGLTRYRKWYETDYWCTADDKYYNPYAPVVNPEYALNFPEYKYSAVAQYGYVDIFKYLRLYEQYPQAEMLVKLGLSKYATSVQLLRKIGKDKAFRKWLILHLAEIKATYYYVGTLLLAYKTGRSLEYTQQLEESKNRLYRDDNYQLIKAVFSTNAEIERFIEYLKKQNTGVSSYSDYLRACNFLNLDMSIERNRLPHDFKRWHDIRIDEYHTAKAIADEKQRKELQAKFIAVAEKYLPLQRNLKDAYIAIIARTPQDLINEGDYLHHCVGRMNYDQRMIREESLIFFIRSKDAPDIPFVTVEYSLKQHSVLQCYGDKDTKPTAQVLDFVHKKWLPYANRKLKQIAA